MYICVCVCVCVWYTLTLAHISVPQGFVIRKLKVCVLKILNFAKRRVVC